jgi:hypothetical protein
MLEDTNTQEQFTPVTAVENADTALARSIDDGIYYSDVFGYKDVLVMSVVAKSFLYPANEFIQKERKMYCSGRCGSVSAMLKWGMQYAFSTVDENGIPYLPNSGIIPALSEQEIVKSWWAYSRKQAGLTYPNMLDGREMSYCAECGVGLQPDNGYPLYSEFFGGDVRICGSCEDKFGAQIQNRVIDGKETLCLVRGRKYAWCEVCRTMTFFDGVDLIQGECVCKKCQQTAHFTLRAEKYAKALVFSLPEPWNRGMHRLVDNAMANRCIDCEICGQRISVLSAEKDKNGNLICRQCAGNAAVRIAPACNRCGAPNTSDNQYLCEDCVKAEWRLCTECGEVYQGNEHAYLSDCGVCQKCAENRALFVKCAACGSLLRPGEEAVAMFDDTHSVNMCTSCFEGLKRSGGGFNGYTLNTSSVPWVRLKHYVKCVDCGKYEEIRNAHLVGTEYKCAECVQEELNEGKAYCASCGQKVPEQELSEMNGERVCDLCKNEAGKRRCLHCGHWRFGVHVYDADKFVCASCRGTYYTECEMCEEQVAWADVKKYGDTVICNSCAGTVDGGRIVAGLLDCEEGEEKALCRHCQSVVTTGEMGKLHDGTPVCTKCLKGNAFFRCAECEEFFSLDYAHDAVNEYGDSVEVCEYCRDRFYSRCDCCGDYIHDSMLAEVGNSYFCAACRDAECGTCGGCGEWFRVGDLFYDEYSGEPYCRHCEDAREGEKLKCGVIYSAKSGKRLPCTFHKGKKCAECSAHVAFTQPFYGVELEVEAPNNTVRNTTAETINDYTENNYRLEEDGSLNCGFEIITQPRTFAAWKKYMLEFENHVLKPCVKAKLKSSYTTTCGLHVHVSKAAWSTKQLFRLFELLDYLHRRGTVKRVAQRDNSTYAKMVFDVGSMSDVSNINKRCSPFNSRYVAVNITSETIEFRMFKGNLRAERVMKAIEFCDSLWKYTRSLHARNSDHAQYCRWLLDNKKRYPNLVEFLSEELEDFSCVSDEKEVGQCVCS